MNNNLEEVVGEKSDNAEEVVGGKSFSKGTFRPSLVSAAWISATANEDGGNSLLISESTSNYFSDEGASERKSEDNEFEDTLSPDEGDKTEADIALFFEDPSETPFREFQNTVNKGHLTSPAEDDERTPFTSLKMSASSEKKGVQDISPASNDFLFELDDDVPPLNPELLAEVDNDKVLSPSGIVPIAPESLTEDDIVNSIKDLMSSKTMEFSTKQWMRLIASHLSIESLPSEWKSTVKTAVIAEAEVLSIFDNNLSR